MLLALQDEGEDLRPVASRLKEVAQTHKGDAWKQIMTEVEEGACLCAYRVALMVEALFGPRLGPKVTTTVIRARFPHEPETFSKSGNLVGHPKVQNYLGSAANPNKIAFGSGQLPRLD